MTNFEEMTVRNEERITAAETALAAAIAESQRSHEATRREMAQVSKILHRDMVLLTFASSLFAVLGPKALALIAMVLK